MKNKNLKICTCAEAYEEMSNLSERTKRIEAGKTVCEGCLELIEVNSLGEAKGLLFRYMAEVEVLRTQVLGLRGAIPQLPPRPPEGCGLPRYGVRWNGDNQPITVPMEDGYWTPYHLAEQIKSVYIGVGDE